MGIMGRIGRMIGSHYRARNIPGVFIAAALCCSSAIASLSAEIPDAVIPEGVGVNIHFVTGHERDLDLIAAAGFKFIRMDFAWAAIESKKGEYKWSEYEQL